MTIRDKLKELAEREQGSVNKFEEYIGVGNGTLAKSGGIASATIYRILKKCPELNLNWLFKDEGEMYASFPVKASESRCSLPPIDMDKVPQEMRDSVLYMIRSLKLNNDTILELEDVINSQIEEIAELKNLVREILNRMSSAEPVGNS